MTLPRWSTGGHQFSSFLVFSFVILSFFFDHEDERVIVESNADDDEEERSDASEIAREYEE